MTLHEAKEEIAKRMKFSSWDDVRNHHSVRGMETTMGEVAELYARHSTANLCVNTLHNEQIENDGHCHLCKSINKHS